jgi:hypothetical protein
MIVSGGLLLIGVLLWSACYLDILRTQRMDRDYLEKVQNDRSQP